MLSLDEAIAHEKELSKEIYVEAMLCHANPNDEKLDGCIERGKYHEQLAQWLEDYKHIKQWKSDILDSFCKYDVSSFEELVTNVRNKTVDDFATKICEILEKYQTGFNMVSMANIWLISRELAEELKAGGKNEN